MRILFAHGRYQQRGGEDRAVESEMAALRAAGHEVLLLGRDNDDIRNAWDAAKVAWSLPGTDALRRRLGEEIAAAAPDLIHAHNIFPLITPSLYDAAQDLGLPVVQTLHNYRFICASSLLMRDGRICEECIGGSPYRGGLHRCYRDSFAGSLALARMIDIHRRRGTWERKVTRFIALTNFSRSRFVLAGFPEAKIAVKPNSPGPLFTPPPPQRQRSGALFVGRLSHEKGIAALLGVWRKDWPPLRVIGEGPDEPVLRRAVAEGRAVALGALEPEAILDEMHRAAACILPSRCYENFPMVLAEAFAAGLPVLGSDLGAVGELIEDGKTGALFDPFDPAGMAQAIGAALADPARLAAFGRAARARFEADFTPERTIAQQVSLYEEAIAGQEAVAGRANG